MNKRIIVSILSAAAIILAVAGGGWLLDYFSNQPAEERQTKESALSKEAEELLENLTIAPEEFLELHPELMELVLTSDGIYIGETAPKMASDRLWSFSVGMPLFDSARNYLVAKNSSSSLPDLPNPEAFKKIFAKKVLTDPVLGYQLADFFSRLKIEPFGNKSISELKGNEFIKEFAQEFRKNGLLEYLSFDKETKIHKVTPRYQKISRGLLARFWAFNAAVIEARPTKGRYISNADLVGVKDVRLLFTEEEKYQENLESLVLELKMKGGQKVGEFGINVFDSSIVIFGEKKKAEQPTAPVRPTPVPTPDPTPDPGDDPIDKGGEEEEDSGDDPIDKEKGGDPIDKDGDPVPKPTPTPGPTPTPTPTPQDPVPKKDYKKDPAEKNNAEIFGGKKEEPGPGPKTEPVAFNPAENESAKDDPELQKNGVNPEEAVEQIDSNPMDSNPTPIVPLTETEKQEIGENNGDWEE